LIQNDSVTGATSVVFIKNILYLSLYASICRDVPCIAGCDTVNIMGLFMAAELQANSPMVTSRVLQGDLQSRL
jgi:hypothetical protein